MGDAAPICSCVSELSVVPDCVSQPLSDHRQVIQASLRQEGTSALNTSELRCVQEVCRQLAQKQGFPGGMGECDGVLANKILLGDFLISLLTQTGELPKIVSAETPRQLPLPKADLLPLGPEVKIISVPGLQAISQQLEREVAAPALLGGTGDDLPSQLDEVVRQVVAKLSLRCPAIRT